MVYDGYMQDEAPNGSTPESNNEFKRFGTFTGGGAGVGTATGLAVGKLGLAGAFGATSVGLFPFVVAGAVIGIAGYGVHSLVKQTRRR